MDKQQENIITTTTPQQKQKKYRKQVWVDKAIHKQARIFCKQNGMKISWLTSHLLKKFIEQVNIITEKE